MLIHHIDVKKLTGNETIMGTESSTIIDYWQWVHSNLIDNTERATFAEFLVYVAVKSTEPYLAGHAYDVLSPEGIKIEVKTSAYIQAWPQKKLSEIIFSIRQAKSWDAKTGTSSEKVGRAADVYVFCLLKHTDEPTLNALDLRQWTFFVLATDVINRELGSQKTITLEKLKSLQAEEVEFKDLREAVLRAANRR